MIYRALTTLLLTLVAIPALAADPSVLTGERMLLWPDGAPGAIDKGQGHEPSLTIYLPDAEKATGTAIVVCPGGGYGGLAIDHEGEQIGQWLIANGIAAFVLQYRHAPHYGHPYPLMDSQRAVRTVRREKMGHQPRSYRYPRLFCRRPSHRQHRRTFRRSPARCRRSH